MKDESKTKAQLIAELRALRPSEKKLQARVAELESARVRAETLQAVTQALRQTLDLHQVFQVILGELQKVVPYDRSSIQVIQEHRLVIVGAALYMTLFRTLLRVLVLQSDAASNMEDAARLIQAVRVTNEYVARTHGDANMFASLFVALLEPTTGNLTYVNAGHNPPLLFGKHSVQGLTSTGMVVGLYADQPFEAAHIQIEPGQTLLVYTDGVTEAFDMQEREYSEARLTRVATDCAYSANALLSRVTADLFELMSGAEQADDIALLALHRQAS